MTGTSDTCTLQMLLSPTRMQNWRRASTKGADSMSPTVPPSSMTHTWGRPALPSTGSAATRWIQSWIASVMWGTTWQGGYGRVTRNPTAPVPGAHPGSDPYAQPHANASTPRRPDGSWLLRLPCRAANEEGAYRGRSPDTAARQVRARLPAPDRRGTACGAALGSSSARRRPGLLLRIDTAGLLLAAAASACSSLPRGGAKGGPGYSPDSTRRCGCC